MLPIQTGREGEFSYGAPPGLEDEIGGLPCVRVIEDFGGRPGPVIYSVWEFTEAERKAIAGGKNLELGICGEPIPPISMNLTSAVRKEFNAT